MVALVTLVSRSLSVATVSATASAAAASTMILIVNVDMSCAVSRPRKMIVAPAAQAITVSSGHARICRLAMNAEPFQVNMYAMLTALFPSLFLMVASHVFTMKTHVDARG